MTNTTCVVYSSGDFFCAKALHFYEQFHFNPEKSRNKLKKHRVFRWFPMFFSDIFPTVSGQTLPVTALCHGERHADLRGFRHGSTAGQA